VGDSVELRADVADVRAALDDVTLYAAPLVTGWGLKNKVLEAMAAGRPVVTTPMGSAGIGAGPGLVEVADPPALAAEASALLLDRDRLAATGAAGRDRVVADFGWDRSAERIERLWAEASMRR
jgi:glycosyltransferase involved in cell wall biosynthesis